MFSVRPTFAVCVEPWGQCGGIGYTGETCCVEGYICTYVGDYWSACQPSSITPTLTPTPTPTPIPTTLTPTPTPTPIPTTPTPTPTPVLDELFYQQFSYTLFFFLSIICCLLLFQIFTKFFIKDDG
jgi:hypothetical protein